jgi:hypothetical protein
MLLEDEVVDAVVAFIAAKGWTIQPPHTPSAGRRHRRAQRWATPSGGGEGCGQFQGHHLAFPGNQHHRNRVDAIAPALAQLRIGIFWVSDDHEVTLQAPWDL